MKKAILVLVVFFISFQLNAQWVQTNSPDDRYVTFLEVSGNNFFATFGNDRSNSVYHSTNKGTDWTKVSIDLPTDIFIESLVFSGNNIFAGAIGSIGSGGVYLSTNNGINWTQKNNGISFDFHDVYSLAVSGTNIFAGTIKGIYLSTDNGASWTLVYTGVATNSLTVNGNNIFAGTGSGLYRSTNNGTNWTKLNNGLPSTTEVRSFVVNGINLFAGTYGNGIYLSTNNGTDWTQVNNGFSTNGFVNTLVVSGNNIFAGIAVPVFIYEDTGSVFLSTNNGTNWTQIKEGLPYGVGVFALAINGTNIFAGTFGAGVWMRPLSELTSVSNEVKTLPQEFTLSQNYPNPFNPSTVIKYSIPYESIVNIRFYNSLGQTVREVNEGYRQSGNYEISFNSAGLASGIYFYSVRAVSADGKKDFSAVKKMILLK